MTELKIWSDERHQKLARLIRALYAAVKELEDEFVDENRKFTLDGHLVGSIGEVVAAYSFNLILPSGTEKHDAQSVDGNQKVQIKLTGAIKNGRISLNSEPDNLIVLQLQDLKFEVVYNGPGDIVWSEAYINKDSKRMISLSKLKKLQLEVVPENRIEMVRVLPNLNTQAPE
jgi:hypothetical protein